MERNFRIYSGKAIYIGGVADLRDLCDIAKGDGHIISKDAFKKLLFLQENNYVLKNRQKVILTFISVKELGFEFGANLNDIYEEAFKLGMSPCPEQTAINMCFQRQPYVRVFYATEMRNNQFVNLFFVRKPSKRARIHSILLKTDKILGPDTKVCFQSPEKI